MAVKRVRKSRAKERQIMKCLWCGKEFKQSPNGRQLYCSDAHKMMAYRQRVREQKEQEDQEKQGRG
jgi:hypothetical protein